MLVGPYQLYCGHTMVTYVTKATLYPMSSTCEHPKHLREGDHRCPAWRQEIDTEALMEPVVLPDMGIWHPLLGL